MSEIKIGGILHGLTDNNESQKHYKIIYNIIRDNVQFVSVSTTYRSENLLEITPKDFIGNNTIEGYVNAQHVGTLPLSRIDDMISEGALSLKTYTVNDVLIRKIHNLLDQNEQLRQKNQDLEDENLLWKAGAVIAGTVLAGLGIKNILDNNKKQ